MEEPNASIAGSSRSAANITPNPDMSGETLDKLSLLDQIVSTAKTAKAAMLRGQEIQVSQSLGHLSSHLEIANEMGVGPTSTPREAPTPHSQSVSPITYQTSPNITTDMHTMAPHNMQTSSQSSANVVPLTGLLPPLSLDVKNPAPLMPQSTAPPSMTPMMSATPDYMSPQGMPQAPPMVHSHSFPNGHQLPSQLHGIAPPTTPIVPSPSFTAALGIAHAPLISSPLVTMPISRPPSPPRPYPIPEEPWAPDFTEVFGRAPEASRRPSLIDGRTDGRPVVNRARSTSVHKAWSHAQMTASVPPSAWHSRHASPEDDGGDDDDSDDEGPRRTKRRRSSGGNEQPDVSMGTAAVLSDDIRRQLDDIFLLFLQRVCSDLEAVDSKGEKLHQVLMPKKMQRLDESTDYRPFKFRIQAFTNAFHEELTKRGISEEILSIKKVKTYLWRQDLISRFNSDGKKAKSKGNHIWNVDAKKLPGGGWVFRPFKRRIIGQPNTFAVVNQRYEWEPRIWDPQAAADTLKPTFSSPAGSLPTWLNWEDNLRLVGMPNQPSQQVEITVNAEFIDGAGSLATVEGKYKIQVVPAMVPIDSATTSTNTTTTTTNTGNVGATTLSASGVGSGSVNGIPTSGYGYSQTWEYTDGLQMNQSV
ncbi:hypothetical protein TREMEDRAFT_31188 [Tremella mesenterica DSM 1558]|uniref:uncharacterized protein n=1 Tax=Tremella mesenterica (strain ATCC 24925 / CBS 8224 / DSM 1558 / NBRC 9311 / NRRL Y-6157 / RJB 2259-6 / UBC 559-6) TaxID=578456 RepID=UPI0003F492D8|nr:uncharacterized protein TREMEDRAFT_31188 [Tremella mesenterica DSM 1558]EIW68876.1 hypothetical protein TREMEDRAFT_31188 [Tremella mesenterica DSM 1558]